MLDIKKIVENKKEYEKKLKKRIDQISLDELVVWYEERRETLIVVEDLKANKNRLSKEIGDLKREGKDTDTIIKEMDNINIQIEELDEKSKGLDKKIKDFILPLPNVLDDDIKDGDKENNEVISKFGKKPDFSFETKDHVELSKNLDLIDYERGTKLGGHGFWIYKGMGARLEWALLNYFVDFHLKNNYEFTLPPHILKEECGYVAGQFPKFNQDVFHLKNNSFLLPTSETAIVNYHRDEILDYNLLPKLYFAFTPCYREEAGSHRTDERGTIRGHQFNKVEMFAFTTPEQADKVFEELLSNAEKLLQDLGLHYQVTKLASKDIGAAMARTYDIEVWIPSMNKYTEVSSVSNARDYQARRGMIRYKTLEGKNDFVNTLNASGLATSRLIPAIIEQFQKEDGSVNIPKVLKPYLGNLELIK